jgi:hypothetical protein
LGASNAFAFATGGTVIYNTATAVYSDANNIMISQGPVCRQAASITGRIDPSKPGAASTLASDRTKPSALTQSGMQTQGKAAVPTPEKVKLAPPC